MPVGLILAIGFILFNIINEKRENPLPKDAYFDWDEYYRDINNGMSAKQQLEKRKRMGYYKSPSNPDWKRYKW